MKTFYRVMLLAFVIGMALLCCFVPWTTTPAESSLAHNAIGYAPIWSQKFSAVPGSRVDYGALAMLTGAVAFFAIVIGAATFFFRDDRGSERSDT
jgi:hypothetical protein